MSDDATVVEERKRGPQKGGTWSPARRAAAAQRRRGSDGQRPDADLIAEEVIDEAVANVTTLAGFIMPIAPYTAVTLAGVIDPDSPKDAQTWLVKSRAEMAGSVLLEHAKRNRRVLAAVARFNLLFKNVELLEVVGSVGAAVAVDAKLMPADASIKLPGGAEYPILYPAIGDTIEFIAGQDAAAEAAERAQGHEVPRRRRRTESADAVSTPQAPYEPTLETPEDAAAMRERLTKRNAELDPTLRREGQTVIEGGVEAT
jgi:hypothetical protein